jgi:Fic family protein
MLVPLILYCNGVLSRPTFYISAYLEHHRNECYACLLAVSRDRDWNGWVAFSLNALVEQAADNTQKAKAILDLYDELKISVSEVTRTPYAIQAIDTIFFPPHLQED